MKTVSSGCEPELMDAEDHLFILYTSGTTGKPKIVPLSHRNLYFGAKNLEKSLKLGSCDRCLSVMPLFHVHGLMVMIATIFTGGFFV